MLGKVCILALEGYRLDGSPDAVDVDLDTTIGQEELRAIPVFGDLGQSFSEWGFHREKGAVMDKARLACWRSMVLNVPLDQQDDCLDQGLVVRPQNSRSSSMECRSRFRRQRAMWEWNSGYDGCG